MQHAGMSMRMELFVADLNRAVAFYRDVLGFAVAPDDSGYASARSGSVQLGLGAISGLPETEGYFTQERLATARGLGVEIVLEIDDIEAVHGHIVASGYPVFEPLQLRPWGLTDFRLVDPDGYYLRITSRRQQP